MYLASGRPAVDSTTDVAVVLEDSTFSARVLLYMNRFLVADCRKLDSDEDLCAVWGLMVKGV